MDTLITLSPGDEELCKQLHPEVRCVLVPYISEYQMSNIEKKDEGTTRIMISHSGWIHNNHLKVFDLLKKYKDEDIQIICPLCYGEDEYIDQIIKTGIAYFGEKFTYFKDLKPKEEYEKIIKSLHIYITASPIQTGLYALITSIVYGAKIFITGNLLYSMNSYGFLVHDLQSIAEMDYSEFSTQLTEEQILYNTKIFKEKYANLSVVLNDWKSIYSNRKIG